MNFKYKLLFELFIFRSGVIIDNWIIVVLMIYYVFNEDGMIFEVEFDYIIFCLKEMGMVIIVCVNVMLDGKVFFG